MTDKEQKVLQKFAENVSRIRANKRLSLRQVASKCEVDYASISRIENGKVNLTLTTLVQLSIGLEVHPKKLLDFEID